MKQILFSTIIFFTLFGQNIEFKGKELLADSKNYISFLQKRNNSRLLSLNGENWSYYDSEQKLWEKTFVPHTYSFEGEIKFRKKFSLSKFSKRNDFILHLAGIRNEAIIKLNNEVIASYRYNGAPFKVPLDQSKLYFDYENTLEIVVKNKLDFIETIPRKTLELCAKNYGGLTKPLFIEIKEKKPIQNLSFDEKSKNLTLHLPVNYSDSLSHYYFLTKATFLSDNLDTLKTITFGFFGKYVENLQYTKNLNKYLRYLNFDQNYILHVDLEAQRKRVTKNKYKTSLYFHKKHKSNEHQKIISKVEQSNSGLNLLSLEEMEVDVLKIKNAGFNAIFFPFDYPHNYYLHLAQKYDLKLYAGLPTYSMTAKQIEFSQTKTYVQNYLSHIDKNGVEPVLFIRSDFDAFDQKVFPKNLHFINSNQFLFSTGNKIAVFRPTFGKYGNLNGFNSNFSEEFQAKKLSNFLKENKHSFLISYYNDFNAENPDLTQKKLGDYKFNQSGIVSLTRLEKKAYRVSKSTLSDNHELAFNPGIKALDENYSFITLGVIILALIVIGFKQTVKMLDSLKRSLFHAHGLFQDTRDRRTLYMGQTMFLYFVHILIIGNIIASYFYFNRDSFVLTIWGNYLLTEQTVISLMDIFDNPVKLQILGVIFSTLFLLILSLLGKTNGFFRNNKSTLKQSITITVWAFIPFLFLMPVSLFLYNALIHEISIELIQYYSYLILIWSLLRWVNGVRVLNDVSRFNIYLYLLIILTVFGGTLWAYLEYFKNLTEYLPYLLSHLS
jgi:hypothetical protein